MSNMKSYDFDKWFDKNQDSIREWFEDMLIDLWDYNNVSEVNDWWDGYVKEYHKETFWFNPY
jgi:hypothetical protein